MLDLRNTRVSRPLDGRIQQSLRRGFTLIELLTIVAITSILSAIALPAYKDYVVRSKIPDATGPLANKRTRLELFFDNNRTYADAPDCAADTTTSRHFKFEGECGANAYVLTATGIATMDGFVFTVNQANAKATSGVPSGWTESTACWVTGKDGTC